MVSFGVDEGRGPVQHPLTAVEQSFRRRKSSLQPQVDFDRLSTGSRQLRRHVSVLAAAEKSNKKCLCNLIPLIDPRLSHKIVYWDVTSGVALVFTALVTPVEVSLYPESMGSDTAIFWINRLIDVIFIIDIFLQFVLMTEAKRGGKGERVWLTNPSEIAHHYLFGWFTIDLLSVLISGLDVLPNGGLQTLQVTTVRQCAASPVLVSVCPAFSIACSRFCEYFDPYV